MNVRTAAALVVGQVLRHQGSLSSLLPEMQSKVPERDRPLLQELCYGCLRWQPQLALYVERLLDKPLRAKDSDIQALLLLGLRSEEHTSELQSRGHLVCRLLLEKKKRS